MEIELRHLRYVVAVADDLSFTRAAQRLRLDQPSLSRQIRKIEHSLGVALFSRSTRSVWKLRHPEQLCAEVGTHRRSRRR